LCKKSQIADQKSSTLRNMILTTILQHYTDKKEN